jgi:autotransporter translocation and assembly factor TamB
MARDASWRIKNIKYHGLNVKGTYSPKGSSDLYADGVIDGSSLSVFKQYLREAEGPIEVKLHASGQTNNPSLNGHIVLSKNMIFPRLIYQPLQDVSGRLDFDGHVIKTDSLTGNIEDGPFTVKGFLSHSGQKLEKFDISLVAQNLRYVIEKLKFKTEFNANVRWYGSSANSNLTGDVTILDGKYSKDFVLLENLAGSSKTEDKNKLPFNDDTMHLNLRIRNTGDLTIRNNIGDIWLRTDVTAEGTAAHPLIKGSIEATEGKVHYLGREFIITKGVVEFRAPYAEPYMEVFAEYEVPSIPDLVVNVTLHGWSDNLQLDLSATKPLERRDIISLLLYGVTEADIKQSQFSASMGQSVLWGQVTSMVEGPVTKFSHLDIFRLEASNPDVSTTKKTSSQNMQISRVYMGKRLSDRLSLEFIADINADDAAQTIRAEYLLTDFLLLKGENSASLKYRFAVSLRFRER